MICPRTKGNCLCANAASCVIAGSVGFYDGVLATTAPPPTLAEIERLALSMRQSSFDKGELVGAEADIDDVYNAKVVDDTNYAALMAAIRLYGRE